VAKASIASKTPGKKLGVVAKPAPGKPAAKPPAAKAPVAKKPVAKQPAAKTVAPAKPKAAAPKPATRTPATKTTAATAAKPAPAASKGLASKQPAPPPAAKPGLKPNPKPTLKATLKPAAKPAPAPTPAPSAPTPHRFTERFGPAARPAPRPMTETAELPKPTIKIDPKLANAWKGKAGRDLTDPELLAMPESEYMGEKQVEFFRTRLQGLKDDLLSNAGETTEHLREDTSIVPDPADRATIEEEHALELRTRDRERKLLKKIAQSLTRLESGEYGYCDETGEPIGLARLLARPTATLSLEAQQRRELKQKMFGN
jgi:DnaK suppressor protein